MVDLFYSYNTIEMSINVLYLGMAHDIMGPLLLVPDLDTLYVLNYLDKAYGSWEEHKDRIRKVLLQGSDKNIAESFWFKNKIRYQHLYKHRKWINVHTLEGPSEILFDTDTPDSNYFTDIPSLISNCYTNSIWRLQFLYNGKVRNLIYYYNFNFELYTWPSEIKNIHYHIWNGSYAWEMMAEEPEKELLRKMMVERSAPESYVFALSFNHKKFPEHIWVYNGYERYGESIAKMKLNFSDTNWWKRTYSGLYNYSAGKFGGKHKIRCIK